MAALAYGIEGCPGSTRSSGRATCSSPWPSKHVYGEVDIDSIAGPSEVVVIVDDSTRPDFTALDLIAQAEHAPGERADRLGRSRAGGGPAELARQLDLSNAVTWRQSLEEFGAVILARDADEACVLADEIAPASAHRHARRRTTGGEIATPARCSWETTRRCAGRLRGGPVARAAHQRHGPLRQRTFGERFSAGQQL